MKFAAMLIAAGLFSAPALADTCAAATEAATRAALDSAAAAGRRTATVRVTCDGERQTFVLHRSQGASGTSVTVRELKRSADKTGVDGGNRASSGTSTAKLIRVGE
jgi:cobalamin biosynthesis Mg chelatase CobN